MGTSWSVKFSSVRSCRETLNEKICRELAHLVTQMSLWDPTSTICAFNQLSPYQWLSLPSEFYTVVDCAMRIARETGGAYDPALGALVDHWGFGAAKQNGAVVTSRQTAHSRDRSGWHDLEFDPDGRRLRRRSSVRLDLNAIAKGFAVDHIAAILRAEGIENALVEIGGELKGLGVKPNGGPWWVEVDGGEEWSQQDRPVLIALHNLSVATSGCERSFERDGQQFSHTIDPRTGRPIENGMISATTLHSSCMMADAYSTALMVLGPAAGLTFAEQHKLPAILTFRSSTGLIEERCSIALEAMLT